MNQVSFIKVPDMLEQRSHVNFIQTLNPLKWAVAMFVGTTLLSACQKNDNGSSTTEASPVFGTYITGDFHQHTTYTDGSWSIGYVMAKNNSYNLDFWVNSEHGGGFTTNGAASGTDKNTTKYWDQYTPNPILGTVVMSGAHQVMWRWQCIRDSSFKQVLAARALYSSKVIFQGLEMNVPGHEHASTGILTNQFVTNPNVNPIAEFEYRFDNNDADVTGGLTQGWTKSTNTGHAKALEAISWLQTNHRYRSWVIPAHPERKNLYSISDFRDLNNAGPDVFFGFESMPGHQKVADRGEYKAASGTYGTCTYGGVGKMSAQVGGLWDAMLSEGRHFWLFANSDFHDTIGDFYPGEYQKNYISVKSKDPQAIVDGMRSGNVFIVAGNLIDGLQYSIGSAVMGQTYNANDNSVTIKIRVHDNDKLNHLDIIGGSWTGYVYKGDAKYTVDDVTATTKVVARFGSTAAAADANGIATQTWNDNGGWKEMSFTVLATSDMYYRLRGTNWGLNVTNQTDNVGNPLADNLIVNTRAEALKDLWFYSNPIWVKAKGSKKK
ncbi:MAG: hypothetical protein Q8928_14305 [Bacteroidota bacterium]|nr:hypothetical protein [Bacteroidota bacterium]